MFDAAVEIGVATFLNREDGVRVALERAGVAPWLAQRLEVFLPIAFGRRLIGEMASIGDGFIDGGANQGATRTWDSEPLWRVVLARAAQADRRELEAIALQSAELQAVNAALNAGSRMEDLVLGPCVLSEPLLAVPEPNSSKGIFDHGGVPSPRQAFHDFLAGHGLAIDAEGRHDLGVFDARVFPRFNPNGVSVQVDFAVNHPALAVTRLLESYAGWGSSWQAALGQTIEKFERCSLHVIIAGLLDRNSCTDQVTWERVAHPGGTFDACVSPQLVLYTTRSGPPMASLLDRLYAALASVELSRQVHALRLFFFLMDGQLETVEVLLDNEPWQAGEEIARAADWPSTSGPLGTRVFLLLVPSVIAV